MAIDLEAMSRKELKQLKADVDKALKSAEKRERREALQAAEKAVSAFGFSLDEITGGKHRAGRRAKALPKYRNPANPEQTWSGLGRKPQWIHEALARGADITDLEI